MSQATEERVSQVLHAIRAVVQSPSPLHEPVFAGKEEEYVSQCIRSGWVSSVGEFVSQFEQQLADYTGARYAIATVNGTSALHVALRLAGVDVGDEVIVPALSFVATSNAVAYCGAVPHFVDVSARTLGVDPGRLEEYLGDTAKVDSGTCRNRRTGRRIAAIVPMHTFGHPCEITKICELAASFQLPVVEDAAESLGSRYRGQHTGTFGTLGIVSFNGNKIVTTGGGGAILTNDPHLANSARHLTTTGKRPHPWLCEHDVSAYNYRMPNINAALGCAQMERLPQFLQRKRKLAEAYREAFEAVPFVEIVDEPQACESNFWLNTLRLPAGRGSLRDEVLQATNDDGFGTRPCWTPLNRLPMFQNSPAAPLPITDQLFDTLINLPSGSGIVGGDD